MNSVSKEVQAPKLATTVNRLQIHLTCPNVPVILHVFRDGLCNGGLSGPRPASDQKRRNSDIQSILDERNRLQGSDSLPSTNCVRLCAMNLTSTNMSHFVTTSVRPGSTLTGGWLENFEYAETVNWVDLLKHRDTIRGSAFLSCWGPCFLIHVDTYGRLCYRRFHQDVITHWTMSNSSAPLTGLANTICLLGML